MKIGIIGSRTLNVNIEKYVPKNTTRIVSGGAKGIDSLAEDYAKKHDIPLSIFRPEYNKYGRFAPLIRNKLIVAESDLIIAIWDGTSKGTKFTIDFAKKYGIPVNIYIIKP